MTRRLGIYVHIPFCAKKCRYCDFPSFQGSMTLRKPYIQALKSEILKRAEALSHSRVSTLYIGGGTPNLLQPEQMGEILSALRQNFSFAPDYEFSCEANPGMLTSRFLDILIAGGVNRISLGAQSADPGLLQLLGRQHDWQQVENAVSLARKAGFFNINIDLMLGIPGQTLQIYQNTLEEALILRPQHLSCYGLILEEGTPLAADVEDGRLSLPPQEEEREMYNHTISRLRQAGLMQYEISNFAIPGLECAHNIDCWKRVDYAGFGSAAHSLQDGHIRLANPQKIEDYIAGQPAQTTHLSVQDRVFESLMLGLRMSRGLALDDFMTMHGQSFADVYGALARPSVEKGLTEYTPDGYFRLTRQGMDVMNSVLIDFLLTDSV